MTKRVEFDFTDGMSSKSMALPFESSTMETSGIRVTRAEFSRLMGCSKQAVTEWVKSGRVSIGVDNRLDPRKAVSQLLQSGDPARIRSRVLQPFVRQIDELLEKIKRLEQELNTERENALFYEAACNGLVSQQKRLAADLFELSISTPPRPSRDILIHSLIAWFDCIDDDQYLSLLEIIGSHDAPNSAMTAEESPHQA